MISPYDNVHSCSVLYNTCQQFIRLCCLFVFLSLILVRWFQFCAQICPSKYGSWVAQLGYKAHFITIKMAYDVLTKEEARQNWLDTGRPDGQNSFEFKIGLPSFLLETSNRNLVLLVYLIVFVGLIPYFTYKYYANSSKFGEKNVMYDSYTWFHKNLTEHTPIMALPEILSGAAEFRQRNLPKTKEERL